MGVEREVRPDYVRECPDMAFPKMRRAKNRKTKCAPESALQGFTNAYLKAKGLTYLRLSEALLANIFRNPQIPVYIKRHIKESVAGWPDNLVLIPLGNGLNLAMALELKREDGKLNAAQRMMDKEIELVVSRTQDDVMANVTSLKGWARLLGTVVQMKVPMGEHPLVKALGNDKAKCEKCNGTGKLHADHGDDEMVDCCFCSDRGRQ
jgi:hypothetical protein